MPSKIIKPFDAFSTLINVLMGTGPILLPPVVAGAGIIQSGLLLLLMILLSTIGAEYMIETLSITNCMKSQGIRQDSQQTNLVNDTTSENDENKDESVTVKPFEMNETIEFGQMGLMLWGKTGQLLVTLPVIIYIIGVLISKGIIVGTTMSIVFEQWQIVNNFYYWIILFFCISGALSFQDVASIAIVQTLIALCRYLTLIMMFVGAFIIMHRDGLQTVKMFDTSEFSGLFGTSMLAFLMHHSIPQMLRPVKPDSAIRKVLFTAFISAGSIFILVPLTGAMTFPNLHQYCYYNTVFDQSPVKFAYYIISFYMFLNIASLPVLTITLRTNLMKMFCPNLMPKNSLKITKASGIITFVIILIVTASAMVLKNQIHFVVNITGGVCGTLIILVLPSLMVLKARQVSPIDISLNHMRSVFTNSAWAYVLVTLAVIFIPFNLYHEIGQLVLQLKGEKAECFTRFIK